MSIGLGQLLLIIIIAIILFGKFPNITQDFQKGIKKIQELVQDSPKSSSKDDVKNFPHKKDKEKE